MKKATEEDHKFSDTLVNAKVAFSSANDGVWADGLLVFYEIFKSLEEAMTRLKHTMIYELDIKGLRRTSSFEADLDWYLGPAWKKTYKPRDSVSEYITYLRHLEKTSPVLLLAFVYHLYMGLLSGGQLLREKRRITNKVKSLANVDNNAYGENVTEFPDNTIPRLKQKLKNIMNDIAKRLDDETRIQLIEEGKQVFRMNNKVIQSI